MKEQAMEARPILFNGDMVRALLDGRKTQTRRPLKLRKEWIDRHPIIDPAHMVNGCMAWQTSEEHPRVGVTVPCPYGKPGDLLWVRETHYIGEPDELDEGGRFCLYRSGDPEIIDPVEYARKFGWKWRPSIFMFRKDSRLTLRIKDVRVELVQDITGHDALWEGIPLGFDTQCFVSTGGLENERGVTRVFERLWNSINLKRGYGWDINPWVWVIEFEILHCNVDELLKEVA